jgi:hypothetical protein
MDSIIRSKCVRRAQSLRNASASLMSVRGSKSLARGASRHGSGATQTQPLPSHGPPPRFEGTVRPNPGLLDVSLQHTTEPFLVLLQVGRKGASLQRERLERLLRHHAPCSRRTPRSEPIGRHRHAKQEGRGFAAARHCHFDWPNHYTHAVEVTWPHRPLHPCLCEPL